MDNLRYEKKFENFNRKILAIQIESIQIEDPPPSTILKGKSIIITFISFNKVLQVCMH